MKTLFVLLSLMLLSQVTPNQYGGTLRLPCTMDVQTLDPHRINVFYEDFDSSIAVVNQVFEGLVCYSPGTEQVEPLLAESWDISDDGLVYTFHLRKNVYWHDGNDIFPEGKSRKMEAEDFVSSWNRATAPGELSPMGDFFSNTAKIQSWQTKGALTFEVTLKQPNPSFLYMLPFPCFSVVPEEVDQKYGRENFSSHAVGTGPFKVKTRADTVVLKYNEDYWKGEPYVTEIEYDRVQPENLQPAFEKGSIDWCGIPSEEWEAFTKYRVVTVPRMEILYLGMNCQKVPFSDKKVRQAINYSLDPGAVLDQIYEGKAVKAVSVLPPGLVCYKERDNLYPRDVEKAKKLLDEAGYTGNPRFTVELKSSESYVQQQFNEVYRKQLEEVGIRLEITYLDMGSLLQAVDDGDTQMFTLGWYADWPYPDQFLFLFHSSNWGLGGNGSFYMNKSVDEYLEKANKESDPVKACELYQKAEDTILEDAVWMLQWRRVDGYAVQGWIQGFSPGGMGEKYAKLDKVWISAEHRQTTRIPQKVEEKGESKVMLYSIGLGVLGLVVVVLVWRRRR